jgi:uncharacterized HAD superfamily protein
MHIGLDFDDTLVDMRKSIVETLNILHKKDFIYDRIKEYGVSSLYGYSFEDFNNFFTNYQEQLHAVEPYPFLKNTIKVLNNKYKLSIMTGRPSYWMDSAHKWVKEHELPIDEILCASDYKNGKAECATLHNVSVFIEDNPSHAVSIAGTGIKVLLLNKPYNQECEHEIL